MKSYKVLFAIGCVAIAFVLGMIIGNAIESKTVDFNGTVTKIEKISDGTYELTAEAVFGGEYRMIVDRRSNLQNGDGESIEAEDVSVGSLILADYRKPLFNKSDIIKVKKLTDYGIAVNN